MPTGEALPASLIDVGEDATQAQVDAMDDIAAAFIEDLASDTETERGTTPKITKPENTSRVAAWDAATRAANERYRMLFGVDAYNARTAAAAKDALAELKVQASSPAP